MLIMIYRGVGTLCGSKSGSTMKPLHVTNCPKLVPCSKRHSGDLTHYRLDRYDLFKA